ncbi:MAG: flagellar biosynthesis protein FlhB [Spirochaetes bacterium]|jgi:flagellar biosynthetic protein FlhB|nr:flagellar biosynthesis protein FlhB [Spirochaetota bacterium]
MSEFLKKKFAIFSDDDLKLYRLDLQRFADPDDEGRTEEPTEKKIQDARKKGQVAKTEELPQSLVVILGFTFIFFLGDWIFTELAAMTKFYIANFKGFHLTDRTALNEGFRIVLFLAKLLAPLFGICLVAGVMGNVIQVGFQFTAHPLQLDFSKIKLSPAEMMKKILISKRVLMNLFKTLFKIAVVGTCSYLIISADFDIVLRSPDVSIATALSQICWIAFKIIISSAVLMLILAVPDYIFQRQEFMESLKMSKQEVKEEFKEAQGDPQMRARLREMQRDILTRNMIREVPKADVIVTNPTHFSIALQWDQQIMQAPAVIAKGVDSMALRIKEVARSNNIMLIENRPLAQALYKEVEIGQEIPAELFKAVSEIYFVLYEKGRLGSVV